MLSDRELRKIEDEYGTPAFLFDTEALKARVAAMKEILGEKVTLCYSIKANPFLIPAMTESLEKLEVCSPGELAICEALQVAPERIVYSGVNKMPDDIREAMDYQAGIFTAESVHQFEKVSGKERGGNMEFVEAFLPSVTEICVQTFKIILGICERHAFGNIPKIVGAPAKIRIGKDGIMFVFHVQPHARKQVKCRLHAAAVAAGGHHHLFSTCQLS